MNNSNNTTNNSTITESDVYNTITNIIKKLGKIFLSQMNLFKEFILIFNYFRSRIRRNTF